MKIKSITVMIALLCVPSSGSVADTATVTGKQAELAMIFVVENFCNKKIPYGKRLSSLKMEIEAKTYDGKLGASKFDFKCRVSNNNVEPAHVPKK